MFEKFRMVTTKYQKLSADMQNILWKYLPEKLDEFRDVRGPSFSVSNGLVGDYQAIEMVGHGKFGQIISCQNVKTGEHVILKKM